MHMRLFTAFALAVATGAEKHTSTCASTPAELSEDDSVDPALESQTSLLQLSMDVATDHHHKGPEHLLNGRLHAKGAMLHAKGAVSLSSGLEALPCNTTEFVTCENVSGVTCDTAECDSRVIDGVAKCHCWKQAVGQSNVSPNGGAQCFLESGIDGPEICDRMANGELWSTYFPVHTLPAPDAALLECPAGTPFAVCSGAKCEPDPADARKAICDCPVVTSTLDTQYLSVPKYICDGSGTVSSKCSGVWVGTFEDLRGYFEFAQDNDQERDYDILCS